MDIQPEKLINMTQIKAVIFDVGGVLHYNSADLFFDDIASEMGISNDDFKKLCKPQLYLFGTGKIDEPEFWRQFINANKIDRPIPSSSLWSRKFENKKDESVLDIVRGLKAKDISVAVCSNTIEPHAKLNRDAGVYDLFPIVVLSHEVGYQKPDPKIFEITLDKLGVKPDEAVFVDDGKNNVLAAEKLGMKGIIFENAKQLEETLQKF